ncbi:MAG: LUD domain-containing protein [Vicinamibacteria bacterium]
MAGPALDFGARVRLALEDRALRSSLERHGEEALTRSAAAIGEPGSPARRVARDTRAKALARVDELLEAFERSATAAGARVHWARDGLEACRLVVEIARDAGAQRALGACSPLGDEIGLAAALQGAGIDLIEGDLGAFLAQMMGDAPAHPAAPVLHRSAGEIAEALHDRLGAPLTQDPRRIAAFVREKVRRALPAADLGIASAAFGIAETGSLVLAGDEGHLGLLASVPRSLVVLLALERVLPDLDALLPLLEARGRAAHGEPLPPRVEVLTGPRRHAPGEDPDGPEALHVVLVDAGRARLLDGPLSEALLCIQCDACLSACPVFRQVGGPAYGGLRAGPIAAVTTPALRGVAAWSGMVSASTLCGACRDACPVEIDLPSLLVHLRGEVRAAGAGSRASRVGSRLLRLFATHPRLWRAALAASRALGRLVPSGYLRGVPPPFAGWTAHRDMPLPAPEGVAALLARRRRE